MNPTEKFARFDVADYLETDEDISAYLAACGEERDPALLIAAFGDVVRALRLKSTVFPVRTIGR